MLKYYGLTKTGTPDFGLVGFNFFSGIQYTAVQKDLLFYGQIANISGGILPNQVFGAIDHLTVSGSPGSYIFQCPDTEQYLDADVNDKLWFTADVRRNVLEANLVNFDPTRTFVEFDDISPFTLKAIGIARDTKVFSVSEINQLHTTFRLHIFWSDVFNDYGVNKDNRGFERIPWVP